MIKRKKSERYSRADISSMSKTPTRMSTVSLTGPKTPKRNRDSVSSRGSVTPTRLGERTSNRKSGGLLGSIFVADALKSVDVPTTPTNMPADTFTSEVKKVK